MTRASLSTLPHPRLLRWLLCLATTLSFFASSPAFAQDPFPSPEDVQSTEDAEDLEESPSPEDVEAQDYDELESFRALERLHLPTDQENLHRLSQGHGVPSLDPLALQGHSPLALLEAASPPAPSSPFDASFSEAIRDVHRDLEYLRGQQAQTTTPSRLPFDLNCLDEPSVQEFLAVLTHPGSKTLRTWLQRAGRWRSLIVPILREEGVPEELFYLAMIESGFKTRVRSPANAGGMWQFIPSTALDQGLHIDTFVDERFDPIKSTRAAARYLKKQHTRFGSWPLAMAAYNGGSGTVSEAIQAFNANDYFKLIQYGAMYDETRRYVPKILAAALVGQHPEAFGFEGLQESEPFSFDEIDAPPDTRLSLLADAAGCSLDTLRDLNPELLLDQTPPGSSPYPLRIPQGASARFVEHFDDLASRYGTSHERLPLRFGQTIDMLAADTGLPPRVIRQINGIPPKQNPPYGSTILLPLQGRATPTPLPPLPNPKSFSSPTSPLISPTANASSTASTPATPSAPSPPTSNSAPTKSPSGTTSTSTPTSAQA